MNSAEVFLLEFDMLTRTSALAKTLSWFRGGAVTPLIHQQLILELEHVIAAHTTRLREVASDLVPAEDWSYWQKLLSVPALTFQQGRAFRDDLRAMGINSLDNASLTPLPQTIAMEAYAHYQLMERATVGLVGYLWFFERIPRLLYPLWIESGRRGGVADKAMQALIQGGIVDVVRDAVVTQHCDHVIRRPRDLGLATQCLRYTAVLFATMLDAALERAELRSSSPEGGVLRGIGQVA